MDTQQQLNDIKARFRLFMNGEAARSMREKGLVYKQNFGIDLPRLKSMASEYEKDHHLASALWKEDIRECKILAGLLQPVDTFLPEIADIWVDDIRHLELAELTCMHLFQHLAYAPAKSLQWMASEKEEYVQVCGFLTAARLLTQKGDMTHRAAEELLDQAVCAFLSGGYHVRNAVLLTLQKYASHSSENAFLFCRKVDRMADSAKEPEQILYAMAKTITDNLEGI